MSSEERKTSRVLTSSKANGISLVREGSNIYSVNSPANGTLTYDVISDDGSSDIGQQSNCAYKSDVSCGSLAGSGSGRNTSKDKSPWTSPQGSLTSTTKEETEVPEEEECPDFELILAAPTGYYAITIDPENRFESYMTFIGSDADGRCLLGETTTPVKRIERIEIPGMTSNCQPTRWSFEEGVRIHCIHQDNEVNLDACTPFLNWQGYSQSDWTNDSVSIGHYGYETSIGKDISLYAKLAGCGVPSDTAFFTKDALVFSVNNVDYDYYDCPYGWDPQKYRGVIDGKGPRIMEGLDKGKGCPPTPELTSNIPHQRFQEIVFYERYCVRSSDPIAADEMAKVTAEEYVDTMAKSLFTEERDPFTGEMAIDRLDNWVPAFQIVINAELRTAVSDDPEFIPTEEYTTLDKYTDDVWTKLKGDGNNATYFDLVDPLYYRIGFAIKQENATNGDWYACVVLYTHELDEQDTTLPIFRIQLPESPDPFTVGYFPGGGDRDQILGTIFPYGHSISTSYRAFGQAPRDLVSISTLTRATFSGPHGLIFEGLYTTAHDWSDWKIVSDPVPRDPPTDDELYGNMRLPIVYDPVLLPETETGWSWWTTGGWFYPQIGEATHTFYIQYDDCSVNQNATYDKTVKIVRNSDTRETRPLLVEVVNKAHFRPSPLLQVGIEGQEDEIEPILTGPSSDLGTSNHELYVGTVYIDESQRFGQSNYFNPWQAITVGSVFHTVSGYTAITYTMPRLLDTTYLYWDSPSSSYNNIYEQWWWMKQEYWAAVIDPTGDRIARWQLDGPPPDYDNEDPVYETVIEEVYVEENTTEFNFEFDGLIKKGSVRVTCNINDKPYVLVDEYLPVDPEDPDTEYVWGLVETYDHEFDEEGETIAILSSWTLTYNAGIFTFKLSKSADVYDTLYCTVDISNVDMHTPIECFGEITQIYQDLKNLTESAWPPEQNTLDGTQPITPNLTITEDGKYAVFTCKIAGFSGGIPRYGPGQYRTGYTPMRPHSIDLGDCKMHCQVFDLENINSDMPERLTEPMFLSETYGDTVILN